MGASQMVQQKMMPMTGADPVQQKMMLFMPILFTFLFITSPAGLALYWFASNVLVIGQQVLTNRMIGAPEPVEEAKRLESKSLESKSLVMSAQEQVVEFVTKVVKDMGLALEAQVETTADGTRINLAGDGAEALLARRGEGLQALQQIVDSAFRKQLGDERLLVDCMDFRRGKDNELRKMAKFLAEKAKNSGIEQNIGPLNAYERRLVHLAVAEVPGVTSESIGDAAVKTVTITATK